VIIRRGRSDLYMNSSPQARPSSKHQGRPSPSHLLHQVWRGVVRADEPKYVAHVDADRAGVAMRPLELVHEAQTLPIKIYGNELSLRIQNRRAAVATHCVSAVATVDRRLRHFWAAAAHLHQALRAVKLAIAVARQRGLHVLVHQAGQRRDRLVLNSVGCLVALHVASTDSESAVGVGVERLFAG